MNPRRLAVQAVASGGVRFVGYGCTLAGTVVIARWLGAAEFGRFSLAMAWVAVLSALAIVGSDQLLLREVSIDVAGWRALRPFVAKRIVVPTAAAIVCVAVVALTQLKEPVMVPGLAALVVIVGLIRRQQSALWARVGFARATLGSVVLRPAGQLVVAGALWVFMREGNAVAALVAAVVAAVMVAVVQERWVRRAVDAAPVGEGSLPPDESSWTKSANRFFTVDAILLVQDFGYTILVGALAPIETVALYVIASRLAALVTIPLTLVTGVLAPGLAAGLNGGNDRTTVQGTVTLATRGAMLLAGCIAAVLLVGHPWLLSLFGKDLKGAGVPLAILVVAHLVNVGCGPVARMLLVSHHEVVVRRAVMRGTVVGVCMAAALIPSLGATGAAIGTAIPLVLWNLEMTMRVRRHLGIAAGPFPGSRPLPASR